MTNNFLKKKYRQMAIIGGAVIIGLIMTASIYQPDYYSMKYEEGMNESILESTGNTVRISGQNIYENVSAITQITYPATFDDDKPNAVILVRVDKKADAIAAAAVTHHPINAPILYTEKDRIPDETLREIKRLDPQGVFVDNNIKIYLIGDIGEGVKNELKDNKWSFRHIEGNDPFTLGKNIDDYLSTVHGDHGDVVLIAPIEKQEYAIVQASWNAHMGDGFLYVTEDGVPEKTQEALANRFGGAYIYILGEINEKVKGELAKFGHIQRIPGSDDIYKQAVGFAGYKDIGKNFGWWINKRNRDFGWGIAESGHNFIFVNPDNWQMAVTSSVLSHKGKHGPILLVEKDKIPEPVINYLKTVKPYRTTPQEQLYNHGWIIGNTEDISENIQKELDKLLSYERDEITND